ncbi:hypothetical protein K490DRAFT_48779 [Saccharata proteae CBS 121410]|uniref:Uncharacterized protein n=1 Tax=Saccharata proteae CBS 121410 TaxID=1314787 RepID=A0A9P4HPQ6_9PEZI|nr:hypothetical protein K490DRAFT_48779 [Saccharata proteae CBS 121410]
MPGTPCSASVPPPPPIVPLPFVVPTGDDDALSPSDDQLSIVSASPVDVNRLSVLSAAQRLSKQGTIASRESLTIPHIDDDKASSVAATLDEMNEEVYSLPPLSRVSTPWGEALDPLDVPLPPSPYPGEDPGCPVTEALPSLPSETQDDRTPKDQDVQHPQQAFLELVPPQSLTKGTNPQSEHVPGSKRSSLNEYRRHSEVSTTLDEARAGQGPTRPRIQSDAAQSVTGSLGDHLPDRLSKVMLSYRTNEWAKHLALAEQPELETIPEPTSPGIAVDRTFSQAKPPAHRSSSASTTPVYSSRSAPSAPPRGIRSSSTPLMHTVAEQTLTESPSEENAETTAGGYTPSPMPSNTLMGRREQLINNKMSTISFATPNIAISAPSDSGSLRRSSRDLDPDNISLAERKQLLEEEDMPLSKRKQLIQQQQQQQQQRLSSQNLQQQSHRSQPRTTSWATPVQGFDSHQPKRSPSGMDAGKREVMMANWRHSVRQDLQPAQTKKADESHRQAMIASTRNQQMAQQQQSMAASYRESMMDSVMRRGDMLDLHQHALRRMQAAANKHA